MNNSNNHSNNTVEYWEEIVNLSKYQSLDVYEILHNYLFHDNIASHSKTYINYPEHLLYQLLIDCNIISYYETIQLRTSDMPNILPNLISEINQLSKKNHRSKSDQIRCNNIIQNHQIIFQSIKNKEYSNLLEISIQIIEIILIQYFLLAIHELELKNKTSYCSNKQSKIKSNQKNSSQMNRNNHNQQHPQQSTRNINVANYIEYVICYRDALTFFQSKISTNLYQLFFALTKFFDNEFPFITMFSKYSNYLLQNHFTRRYSKIIELFPEQKLLLNELIQSPQSLFLLPWNVGVGKTSLLPIIAQYYQHLYHNTQVLYCVPYGPLRDQNAAYLYRCGIPFAFIETNVTMENTLIPSIEFILQPSYNCANLNQPLIYIIDPIYAEYYLSYLNEICINPLTPLNITLPSKLKKKYHHLTLSSHTFSTDIVLILDEPQIAHQSMNFILNNLPQKTIIMSATCANTILTEEMKCNYLHKYNNNNPSNHPNYQYANIINIPGQTIGVSTTLIGYWLENNPILSPLHQLNITYSKFIEQLVNIENNLLLKRYLSPLVFVDIYQKIKKIQPSYQFNITVATLNYNNISNMILMMLNYIADYYINNDEIIQYFFSLNNYPIKHSMIHSDPVSLLNQIFSNESKLFSDICVISVPNISYVYNEILPLIDTTNPYQFIEQWNTELKNYADDYRKNFLAISKSGGKTKETMEKKEGELALLSSSLLNLIPIPSDIVINTFESSCKYIAIDQQNNYNPLIKISKRYNTKLSIRCIGDLSNNPHLWNLELPTLSNISPMYNYWRLRGVGAISFPNNYYMQCQQDIHEHKLSFLMIDELGSYGLNMNISKGILFDFGLFEQQHQQQQQQQQQLDHYRNMYLQVAGRIGRYGQDDTGYLFITSYNIFQLLMGY